MRLFYLLMIAGLLGISCRQADVLPDNVRTAAGKNGQELQRVLDHYDNDPLKQRAAMYLLENMPGHYTATSKLFASHKERLIEKGRASLYTLNLWWKELGKKQTDERMELSDATTLTADFLIKHIDQAFEAWTQAAWKDEVPFEHFCRFILPYRFFDEELKTGSSDSLYRIYRPLIAGVRDMRKAFAILQRRVWCEIGSGSSSIPYTLNVLDMRRQTRATCQHRCILLASVARAVGLPVAIDQVCRWSNYSHTGHAWVSLVTQDGTYTVAGKDSIARCGNPIDASSFKCNPLVRRDHPYDSRFAKRAAKVWRTSYAPQACMANPEWDESATEILRDSFRTDVSEAYGLDGWVEGVTARHSSSREVYLCTFSTGNDWEPVACSPMKNGRYVFHHLGKDVVYLPAVYDGDIQPLEAPFILSESGKRSLTPDMRKRQQLVLTRKYPLTGNFLNNWSTLIGSCIEGSNRADFRQADLLATVTKVPAFENVIRLPDDRRYRYIRFRVAEKSKTPLTEIVCMSDGKVLTGKPFCNNAKNLQKCFDGDTYTPVTALGAGYSVGMDFGRPVKVTDFIYYPKNDDNFIVPGGDYELYYYDPEEGWTSLGMQTACERRLIFDNVPTNALFLLRRHDKGNEERVFTYENHRQIWW